MEQRNNFKNFTRKVGGYLASIDITLFATIVAISLFGIINMYGISGNYNITQKQASVVFIGLCLMIVFSFIDYRLLKNYSLPVLFFYLLAVFLLALTLYSRAIRGVNSWIILGNFTFEPSELAKLVLIILMAKYFSQRHILINHFRHIIISGIYYAIPAAIIILQPDLGSAIIFTLIWLGILLASGINKKHLAILAMIGVLLSGLSWYFVLKDYQKVRIISFVNPYKDPRGSGYNLIQSKIAIGSGYWFGSGFGKGQQVKLGFLPEPKNDFIFSATAEQFGLVGITSIIILISIIISRILYIGRRSVNNFGKLFSIGLSIFIFSHAFIGAAVNIGLMPVTGIPFPFLSYGGSNFVAIAVGLGIIQSIKRYG